MLGGRQSFQKNFTSAKLHLPLRRQCSLILEVVSQLLEGAKSKNVWLLGYSSQKARMSNIAEQVHQEERLQAVRSILISQPAAPLNSNSFYHKLAAKYNIEIGFRPFITIEAVSYKAFQKQKVDILDHTAIIFTSRNAVDHFFHICGQLKLEIPSGMKYFCIFEQTANYLQKYISVRKRKLFVGKKTAVDLFSMLKKHKDEKFLFPCSNVRKNDIPKFLKENNIVFSEAVLYRTIAADLSDLQYIFYDMIAFFSPSGVNSLFQNFPDFKQKNTRIAAFGPTTTKAVLDHGLILDVEAPLPNAPSMIGAIELYVRKSNGIDKLM